MGIVWSFSLGHVYEILFPWGIQIDSDYFTPYELAAWSAHKNKTAATTQREISNISLRTLDTECLIFYLSYFQFQQHFTKHIFTLVRIAYKLMLSQRYRKPVSDQCISSFKLTTYTVEGDFIYLDNSVSQQEPGTFFVYFTVSLCGRDSDLLLVSTLRG